MRNLDDASKASVEKLRALKAGSDFDRDYIRYEVEGHRKLLDIQEVYLKASDNLDQANVAKLARGMIKEHLALLADLGKEARAHSERNPSGRLVRSLHRGPRPQ